jgi:hypothetical protein
MNLTTMPCLSNLQSDISDGRVWSKHVLRTAEGHIRIAIWYPLLAILDSEYYLLGI